MSDTYHIYLPFSIRGEEGYPPVGAVAMCGHVKNTDIRRSVPFQHPNGCQACGEAFDGYEAEYLGVVLA